MGEYTHLVAILDGTPPNLRLAAYFDGALPNPSTDAFFAEARALGSGILQSVGCFGPDPALGWCVTLTFRPAPEPAQREAIERWLRAQAGFQRLTAEE